MILEQVSAILESIGAPWALIGGQAVLLRGYARTTLDYDFLTTDDRVMDPDVWRTLEQDGAEVEIRKGDPFDPVAGVVHITFRNGDADVILAKWKWEAGVIDRAERLPLRGMRIPVPTTSDLILLKLSAGGPHDLHDVSRLLERPDRATIVEQVDQRIEELQPAPQEAWKGLRNVL